MNDPTSMALIGLAALVVFSIIAAIVTRLAWMIILIPLRIVLFPFRLVYRMLS